MICSLPITIQNGPTDQLTITGDQESMQLVKTKVNNNGTLKIKLSKQSFFSALFKPTPKLRCALTVAKRNELTVQTTKEVRLRQLAINTLRFALSKSACCVGSLKRVEHLDVTACNKATVKLTGTASQQTIQLDDATNYYAEKLASTNVSIIANMSGTAKVQASKEISGSKDGSGILVITNVPAMVKIANVNPDVGNIRMPKAQVDPDLNRKSIQEAQQERYSS